MDKKTRKSIEQIFDNELKGSIQNDLCYLCYDIIPMLSKEDFLLGLVVGKLNVVVPTYLSNPTPKDLQEFQDIIKMRLPEIHTKILTELEK
jgi:hypothetical protein